MTRANGSYRNHCPFCLYSKHQDIIPGDRASTCGGLMEPQHCTTIQKRLPTYPCMCNVRKETAK
ncbi:RNHCP domain-containing protein [Shouchella hunanensis]|uniref:RNHCP domain-containing protein n=1 Tax=Shouchella hunanensis TaxID=766894 RepID=A0ABY7WDH4_9BACI|nr:RNHCP domain-containing protein [Shouchella hunanensis]WDF05905.1 RNHCP domain-containing protein [Shouchella hunanensis]